MDGTDLVTHLKASKKSRSIVSDLTPILGGMIGGATMRKAGESSILSIIKGTLPPGPRVQKMAEFVASNIDNPMITGTLFDMVFDRLDDAGHNENDVLTALREYSGVFNIAMKDESRSSLLEAVGEIAARISTHEDIHVVTAVVSCPYCDESFMV